MEKNDFVNEFRNRTQEIPTDLNEMNNESEAKVVECYFCRTSFYFV